MGIFDKLKNSAIDTVVSAAGSIGNRAETFTFAALPESLAELRALPEAALDSPFQTAALTVLALCAYAADRNIGQEMLNWLRGPRPLERAGHLFPQRPLPRRKGLPALHLLCGRGSRKQLYALPALYRRSRAAMSPEKSRAI